MFGFKIVKEKDLETKDRNIRYYTETIENQKEKINILIEQRLEYKKYADLYFERVKLSIKDPLMDKIRELMPDELQEVMLQAFNNVRDMTCTHRDCAATLVRVYRTMSMHEAKPLWPILKEKLFDDGKTETKTESNNLSTSDETKTPF